MEKGKTVSVALRRDLANLTTVACADFEEHFSPDLSCVGLGAPQCTTCPSCGKQDTKSGPDPGSRIVWDVGLEQSQMWIWVLLENCPTQPAPQLVPV